MSHISNTEKYFDEFCIDYRNQFYKKKDDFRSFILKSRKNYILDLTDTSDKKILDVGCGSGELALGLAKRGNHVFGIDISSKMLELCRQLLEKNNLSHRAFFQTMEAGSLVFPDECFDIIICSGVVQYIDDEDTFFNEIRRILMPDGFLILTVPNLLNISALCYESYKVLKHFIPKRKQKPNNNLQINLSSQSDIKNSKYNYWLLKKRLEKSGLVTQSTITHGYNFPFTSKTFLNTTHEKSLNHTFLKHFATNYILKLSKK